MDVELVGSWDPDLAWDGASLIDARLLEPGASLPIRLAGAAAGVHGDARRGWRMFRDPLGINKLFWSATGPDRIVAAARPYRLVKAGVPFETIRAFPRGTVLDILDSQRDVSAVTPVVDPMFLPMGGQVASIAAAIRRTLDGYIEAVCAGLPQRPVYVCLSGGLDSTGIALLVRDHVPDLVFVSFDLVDGSGRSSEDRETARRIARDFGVALIEVDARFEELRDLLDIVLIEGIDWRPFNVHAVRERGARWGDPRGNDVRSDRSSIGVHRRSRERIPCGLCSGGGRRRRPVLFALRSPLQTSVARSFRASIPATARLACSEPGLS